MRTTRCCCDNGTVAIRPSADEDGAPARVSCFHAVRSEADCLNSDLTLVRAEVAPTSIEGADDDDALNNNGEEGSVSANADVAEVLPSCLVAALLGVFAEERTWATLPRCAARDCRSITLPFC